MKRSLLASILVLSSWFLVLGTALATPQKGLEKILQQAEEKEKAGDYEGAQALYESILKDHPNYEKALLGLGQVHYWQGNYKTAIDAYAKILELEPDHVGALVGTAKAYVALGKTRKAQEFFNRALKLDPENEEAEAAQPQLARKTRIQIHGGYITENLSYAAQTQGEYQEIRITKEKAYGIGLKETYLQRFGKDAFDTELDAHYYFLENTRVSGALSFAPKVTIVPKQSYSIGLAHTVWKITPEVNYQFQDYTRANLHNARVGVVVEPFEFIKIGGGYEYQTLKFATTSRNFHGGFASVQATPLEWLTLHGFYKNVQRGFEAGRVGNPFVNYRAHIGGGGISLDFVADYSIRFDARFEDRNNGESSQIYTVAAGYSF